MAGKTTREHLAFFERTIVAHELQTRSLTRLDLSELWQSYCDNNPHLKLARTIGTSAIEARALLLIPGVKRQNINYNEYIISLSPVNPVNQES